MPLPRLRAPLLPNTGSVARDNLASERTFLAWIRTALGFTALGMGVERFSHLMHPPPPSPDVSTSTSASTARRNRDLAQQRELARYLMALGAVSLVYGAGRYFATMKRLERGVFRASRWGAAGVTVGVGVLVAGGLGGVWAGGDDGS